MVHFTEIEQQYLAAMRSRLIQLFDLLQKTDLQSSDDLSWWLQTIQGIRSIQGNTSNDLSFLGCLLAKQYLTTRHNIPAFDVAIKPQGAPGLDIDVLSDAKERIIAEIKTTVPYAGAKNNLGANQKETFKKDFRKLMTTNASFKYFFVTDRQSFDIVQSRYQSLISGVEVVLLTAGLPENTPRFVCKETD
jgi:hypothetical protein